MSIESNLNYYWLNDRLACLKNCEDEYLDQLPRQIKNQILTVYLFQDIFKDFKNFFMVDTVKENRFLYDISFGFMPRKFGLSEPAERLIYDEEDQVPEMYFVTEGVIGIGFSLIARKTGQLHEEDGGHYISKKFSSTTGTLICANYVVNS